MKQSIKKMLFCTLLLLNFDASAHHSTVVFDEGKTELITGEVTRFVLRNPHMILSVDVPDEDGEAVLWKLEGQGIGAMQAMGFDRDSITAGDIITVKISPLKNGRPGGLVLGLIGADGRAYNMEIEEEDVRQVYPALMTYVPPPSGETWQIREEKTRPPQLPIISKGTTPGENPVDGKTMGALDPDNLAKARPPAPFDLTGLWQFRGEDEWRANYGSFEFKPTPVLTAKGKAYHEAYLEASEKGERFGDPTALCYPPGMPRFMTRYGALMMMQYPTAIFMVSRLNNDYRVIFTDGRERLTGADVDRNWQGESLGHWEGDTLVVETSGFIGDNHLIQAGILAGEQLKIVERISLINDGNTMVSEYTFTDPEHWVGEWKHTKFRDRVLRSDVREANCIYEDNFALPGMSR
ncbi:DUF6152 family protein [Gammaproteobacteria bacterium]|nr:DUF6152 family protein [Gammaproteobacteria bacterium]